MAWQDDMTELLRVMVNDMDTPQAYSDDKLLRVLMVGAFQVLQQLTFNNSYSISIANQTITPDPTVTAFYDPSFINLVTMKAACIIDRGAAIVAAQRAISVRDGGSAVDLRGVFQGKLALLEKGWCAVYEDARLEYQAGKVRVAGALVMTPFRLYAQGGYGLGQDGYLGGNYYGGNRNRDFLF